MNKSGGTDRWEGMLDSVAGPTAADKLAGYVDSAKFDLMDSHFEKIDRMMTRGWHRSVVNWASTYNGNCESAFLTLSQGQRGWLAKGVRDWSNYIANASNWLAIELQRTPVVGLFDLKTFLHRRQLRGMERGTRWARWSKRTVRAWLRRLGDALLERVAERLRGDSGPKVLLALLKAPPGWAAARFYLDFQVTLPRLLERLIEVQAPNAPSLPPGHLTVLGGNVA